MAGGQHARRADHRRGRLAAGHRVLRARLDLGAAAQGVRVACLQHPGLAARAWHLDLAAGRSTVDHSARADRDHRGGRPGHLPSGCAAQPSARRRPDRRPAAPNGRGFRCRLRHRARRLPRSSRVRQRRVDLDRRADLLLPAAARRVRACTRMAAGARGRCDTDDRPVARGGTVGDGRGRSCRGDRRVDQRPYSGHDDPRVVAARWTGRGDAAVRPTRVAAEPDSVGRILGRRGGHSAGPGHRHLACADHPRHASVDTVLRRGAAGRGDAAQLPAVAAQQRAGRGGCGFGAGQAAAGTCLGRWAPAGHRRDGNSRRAGRGRLRIGLHAAADSCGR